MPLDKDKYKELQEALLSAFPDREKLKQMVRFRLDENLDAIASGQTVSDIIFNLIEWADCQGRLQELIEGAYKENDGNHQLQAFYDQWRTPPKDKSLAPDFYYVERPNIENPCYQEIMKPGALIRIKAPNTMGKTSLMNKIVNYAGKNNGQTVIFRFLGRLNNINNMEAFVKFFCIQIGKKLGLENKVEEYMDKNATPLDNATDYFEHYLLSKINNFFVLALDDVDIIFEKRELADDFCILLRYWHELAPNSIIWAKLRLIIVHSTEYYSSINIKTSPLYNVGFPVNLPEFNIEEIRQLTSNNGFKWTDEQLEDLIDLLGGHPFLLKSTCNYFKVNSVTFLEFPKIASGLNSPFKGYLRTILNKLNNDSILKKAFHRVINTEKRVQLNIDVAEALQRLGLVKLKDNLAEPRCKLYRAYFNMHIKEK